MSTDSLWNSIPSAVRARDAEAGGVLRALVEVLAEQAAVVGRDIDQLQDDWFIETCAEWLVPYIGELVGTRSLHPLTGSAGFSNRARVADTIRFRRRKGTAAMLEELARVATGWRAHAVEFFETLATTQHVNHVRLAAPATALIRAAEPLELVGGPFDPTPHTLDVRSLGSTKGWHNLPNVGLFLWPLSSYPLDRATAAPVATPHDGRWFVDPLGVDRHLTGPTVVESSIDSRSDEANVPHPLRRRPLHDELDAVRESAEAPRRWFSEDDPAAQVWIQAAPGTSLDRVPPADLSVGDLSDWSLPSGSLVRLDPVLGRVTVAAGRAVHRLAVSWCYAAAGDLGAGPYPRRAADARSLGAPDWQMGVSATDAPVAGRVVGTIAEAVDAWHAWQAAHPSTIGRIVLMDSHRHTDDLTGPNRIEVGEASRLVLLAANWPTRPDGPRVHGDADPTGVRPCLVGDVEFVGTGTGERPGEVVVDGVLLAGSMTVGAPPTDAEGLGLLEIRHSTLVPSAGGLVVASGNDRLAVELFRTQCGPIAIAGDQSTVAIVESVVDGAGPAGAAALHGPGTAATLSGATMLGTTTVRSVDASDTIFDDVLTVARRQTGCVRFSYLTPGSVSPRRYRCQPGSAQKAAPTDEALAARLEPAYLSRNLTDAGYARLSDHAAPELRTGAETGAEMGAHRFVLTPQRLANLMLALEEYLPFDRIAAALPVLPREGDTP